MSTRVPGLLPVFALLLLFPTLGQSADAPLNQQAQEKILATTRVFDHANLDGVDFAGADLNQVRITASSLKQSNLSQVQLNNALLRQVNLEGADLSQADLSGSKMTKASTTAL